MTKQQIIDLFKPLFNNKYFLAGFVFVVWISIFDDNNLIERFFLGRRLAELKEQKEHYAVEVKENKERLLQLKTDNESLEKFAREKYLMKKPNEVIYLIEK